MNEDLSLIDVFEVLGLDRGDSTEDLFEEVRFLRRFWEPQAAKPDRDGDRARASLVAIELGERVFVDDQERVRYETRLAGGLDGDLGLDASVDFYDLLSLDRGDSTEEIARWLAQAKLTWLRRSSRPGVVGEQAQEMVGHIEAAELVFCSEEMRRHYDRVRSRMMPQVLTPEPLQPSDPLVSAEVLVPEPVASPALASPPPAVATSSPVGVSSGESDGGVSGGERNLYERLGLDPLEPAERLLALVRDALKPSWQVRASRAGQVGLQAREKLADIALAEEVFASDRTKEEYDRRLRRQPRVEAEAARVDWLGAAWNYYFKKDLGAAVVAARKAREQEPDSALPFVVTAWIELADGELRRAKENADEAFVLDDLGEDSVDVHHVRGAVFLQLREYGRAIESFDRALAKATDGEAPEILLGKARAEEIKADIPGLIATCVRGLSIAPDLSAKFRAELEQALCRAVTHKCASNDPAASLQCYVEVKTKVDSGTILEPSKSYLLSFINRDIESVSRRLDASQRMPKLESRSRALERRRAELEAAVSIEDVVSMAASSGSRVSWMRVRRDHEKAQEELEAVDHELRAIADEIDTLKAIAGTVSSR